MIVSSIDIGTNTVLMLIAEVDPSSKNLRTIKNYHSIPRLGKGLKAGNPIKKEKISKLISILTEYKAHSDSFGAEVVIAVATNAFRIASNSSEILKEIKRETGITIKIISGEEEALYSYLGATSEIRNMHLLVIDIGGGSTELIIGEGKNIKFQKSFSVGVVSGTETFFHHNPPAESEIELFKAEVQKTFNEINPAEINPEKAIAVAGTPTTLASIQMRLREYNEDVIEGSLLNIDSLKELLIRFSGLTVEEIRVQYPMIAKGREDVILAGTIILHELLYKLRISEVMVSTKGIRYGAVYKYLNQI